MTMQYSDHVPTCFDHHIEIDGRERWLVCPVSITRDTADPVTLSNWAAQLDALGGECDTVEVHRFGHWGPGWYELLLVHPSRVEDVHDIARALDNYPVLDDEDLSGLEAELSDEAWETVYRREMVDALSHESRWSVGGPRPDFQYCDDELVDRLWFAVAGELSWAQESTCEGVRLNVDGAVNALFSTHKHVLVSTIVDHCRRIDG